MKINNLGKKKLPVKQDVNNTNTKIKLKALANLGGKVKWEGNLNEMRMSR